MSPLKSSPAGMRDKAEITSKGGSTAFTAAAAAAAAVL